MRTIGDDERSVSNTVSIVLLVGMVIAGATVVLVVGTESLNTLQDGIDAESQEKSLREVDSKLSSLAFDADRDRSSLAFGDLDQQDVRVDRFGSVNVTINRAAECSANVSFSSIRIQDSTGRERAYEMGGIWTDHGDTSTMESPPAVRFENGTLSISVVNVSGYIGAETIQAVKNVTRSTDRTRAVRSTLYRGDCGRPDNVTMVVQSDFYDAWYDYLGSEIDATVISKHPDNRSVYVYLNQSQLPVYTNESTNRMIDLNGDDYVDIDTSDNAIEVTKNADVNYTVTVTPLASGTQVGEVRSFDAQQIYRPAVDVVFVVDESGSMSAMGPGGTRKYRAARNSMKMFLGLLNESRDRAGLVGFSHDWNRGTYDPAGSAATYRPDGMYLSSDFDELNDSIETTSHAGGTQINAGFRTALPMMELRSSAARQKVMILLSDGKNDPSHPSIYINGQYYTSDEATRYWARRARDSGITIYTIGFGQEATIDTPLLRDVARITGGEYHYASNAQQLTEVFRDIASSVAETRALARPAVSLNVSTGSTGFYPQIDGDPKWVANGTGPDGGSVPNINDPTTAPFSITFAVEDGQNISMNALSYDCAKWATTERTVVNESTNETYSVVRCAEVDDSSRTVLQPDDVTIYRDGADVTPLLDAANASDTWYQADLKNETLLPYLDDGTSVLDIESNQAIVVFDFDDTTESSSRLVVLLEIGQSERAVAARGTVIVTVTEIELERET